MTSSITSIDDSIKHLATTYQTAIKATIEAESAPLKRIQSQKDTLEVRKGVYTDIKTNFDALQSAVQALISTQTSYGLKLVAKGSVTPGTAGSTVVTLGTTSEDATVGDFDIAVTQLAKANSRAAGSVASPDLALGKSGTFWLGGTGSAALQTETAPGVYSAFVASDSVTAAAASAVASGQRELGTGAYTLQVRDSGSIRQFRLVNADGTAVSIRKTDGSSGYTSEWQNMTSGAFDTGRGQTLTLNASATDLATSFYYTAKGTSITISASDTQRTIVNALNAASQPEGRDFRASIVAGQMVLTSAQTGENHAILYSDGAGLGFNTELQAAQNAKFTVNGMNVSKASNSNLTDIINGATISLAGDAEGKSARLSLSASTDKAAATMNTFVSKFNTALSHLADKMATTSKTENGKTTYTRGPLSGETIFSSFRTDLLSRLGRSFSNSGSLTRLEEIGVSFDKNMKMTFDSAKFSEALKNNATDVTALLDTSMSAVNTVLSRYTGTSGLVSRTLSSLDSQNKEYDQRIAKYNTSLETRKQALYNLYLGYQTQLVELGNTATIFGINLGSVLDKSS